jgi:AraC-like DNA-binding protein
MKNLPKYTVVVPITGTHTFIANAASPEAAVTQAKEQKPVSEEVTLDWARAGLKEESPKIAPGGKVDWGVWDPYLGKLSDAEIAQRAGCSRNVVAARRKGKKIKPLNPKRKAVNWTRWDSLLGQMSDADLAQEIGCSRSAVMFRRQQLRIPPYRATSSV